MNLSTNDDSVSNVFPDGPESQQPVVSIVGLKKTFRRTGGEMVAAVNDVSLEVKPGELVVLLGPSGCGKTTLLRCIAGLEESEAGEIHLDGKLVVGPGQRPVPPEKRNIGMMFQSYALWPHMTVQQNVAYPLEARGVARRDVPARVEEILSIIGIEALANQHPGQLSGGQQQRVALARSLVAGPRVMLFDEPLSNVDAKVREQLRFEIVEMQRKLGFAGIYVTHDQEEAMQLADRLAVMSGGQIAQLDPPKEVYRRPATNYVAEFVGALNSWRGTVTRLDETSDTAVIDTEGLGSLTASRVNAPQAVSVGDIVSVIVRPESVKLLDANEPGSSANQFIGRIDREVFGGPHSEYRIRAEAGAKVRCWAVDGVEPLPGEQGDIRLAIDPKSIRLLPRDGEVRAQSATVAVDPQEVRV